MMLISKKYPPNEANKNEEFRCLIRHAKLCEAAFMYCRRCGAVITPDMRYCTNCGDALTFIKCPSCGHLLQKGVKFCTQCGKPLNFNAWIKVAKRSIKERFEITKKRFNEKVEQLNERLSTLQANIQDPNYKILGRTLNYRQKETLTNAIRRIQERIATSTNQEELTEAQEWLDLLPERLDQEKCFVCFKKLSPDDANNLAVCPYCEHGGHYDHFVSWLTQKNICPLCRNNLTVRQLKRVRIIRETD